jgi:hypothetical protein
MPPDEGSGLRTQLEAPLRHICEQSVPSGKSNQNPAYARTAVLTEAAMLCLAIENMRLLSMCLVKVRRALVPWAMLQACGRDAPPLRR